MVPNSIVRISLAILFCLALIPIAFFILVGGWRVLLIMGALLGVGYLVYTNLILTNVNYGDGKFDIGNWRNLLDRLKLIARKASYFIIGFFFIWLVGAFVGRQYFKNENTHNECEEMVTALNHYYDSMGKYPENLTILISNNPLRRGWTEDQWNTSYKYSLKNEGKDFVLMSAGSDKEFNTKDDLIFGRK